MQAKFIDHKDKFLDEVIELGKRNSATLGLMPRDAYTQQARKKCIVVAFENEKLLGYCLFRVTTTKGRIGITQVCVIPERRRQGLSRLLLDQIQNKYKAILKGMLVSCREDYVEACNLWKSYGFVAKKRVRSRSQEEKYLVKFWYDFDQKDLFSYTASPDDLRVVLDLNILIRLREGGPGNEEIYELLSDWLTDEVDYWYAKETLNEIHRDHDHSRTAATLQFLSRFNELVSNSVLSQKFLPMLEDLHPGDSENHISDRKQLAECKANDIGYFITLDKELIANRDRIYEKLGVSILRPGEFVLEIDELKNRKLYEPIRLQGARFEVKRLDSKGLMPAIDLFLNKELREKKIEFEQQVLTLISDSKNSTARVIASPEGELIALYGLRRGEKLLSMDFVRVKNLSIRNTLFNQILVEIIREAISGQRTVIKISEKNLNNDQIQILISNGFYEADGEWIKIALSGISPMGEVVARYEVIGMHPKFTDAIAVILNESNLDAKERLKLELEKKLWPFKLSDLTIPTFIVPIKPLWASQLFDYKSSDEMLFAAPAELSWSRENVYYRSVKPDPEIFPARILWYASQEKGFRRQKAIVGCSYLNNVVVGEAKQLFSIFKRFGIYRWPEILKLAKGNGRNKIKALQFSDTEIFERPISFKEVNEVIMTENFKAQTFVSPVKVNNLVFNRIYELGTGKI